jgi:hypothetical protein
VSINNDHVSVTRSECDSRIGIDFFLPQHVANHFSFFEIPCYFLIGVDLSEKLLTISFSQLRKTLKRFLGADIASKRISAPIFPLSVFTLGGDTLVGAKYRNYSIDLSTRRKMNRCRDLLSASISQLKSLPRINEVRILDVVFGRNVLPIVRTNRRQPIAFFHNVLKNTVALKHNRSDLRHLGLLGRKFVTSLVYGHLF